MALLDPTLDLVFHLLFLRNSELLRAMLAAVLAERVDTLELVDRAPALPSLKDKRVIFDLRGRIGDATSVDIEMQRRVHEGFLDRLVFYGARELASRLGRGSSYASLGRVVSVVWTSELAFPGSRQLHLRFRLREQRERHLVLSRALTLHVIQLPRAGEVRPPRRGAPASVHRWARFLASRGDEAILDTLAEEDPTMAKAREALEDLSKDPEVERRLEEWFAEGEFWHEYYLHRAVEKAEARGLARGFEEGIEKGLEEGIEKGIEKGIERARRALVTSIERRLIRRLRDRLTKQHRSRVAGSSLDELTRLDALVDEATDEQLLEQLG